MHKELEMLRFRDQMKNDIIIKHYFNNEHKVENAKKQKRTLRPKKIFYWTIYLYQMWEDTLNYILKISNKLPKELLKIYLSNSWVTSNKYLNSQTRP